MSTDNAKTKAHGAESASTARLDFPTWDEAISGITDSRFVGHQKIPRLNTNCTRDGARIMYDRLYVLMKSNTEAHRRDAAGGPSGGADCSAAAGQEKGD